MAPVDAPRFPTWVPTRNPFKSSVKLNATYIASAKLHSLYNKQLPGIYAGIESCSLFH